MKSFPFSSPLPALGLLSLLLLAGDNAAGTLSYNARAYIERGDRVEKHYQAYAERLAKYHTVLVAALKSHAPDLLPDLQAPEPILQGYQILPRIIAAPASEDIPSPPVAYSWPWTDRLIDRATGELSRNESELRRLTRTDSTERQAALQALAMEYRQQNMRLRSIHAHVQYNRLWQAAVAADRSGYDRETDLLYDVIEHHKITGRLSRLRAGTEGRRPSAEAALGTGAFAAGLSRRVSFLGRRIDQAVKQVQSPPFMRLETSANEWIFHVPLVTDIEDRNYVNSIKEIIENAWRLQDSSGSYRVEIEVTHISPAALYRSANPPSRGQNIDVQTHLDLFPPGVALLTTGGPSTHVQRHAIVLGPGQLAPQIVAHEFGHILGFRDAYVRGYKTLGKDGFQVIEIVADPDDIMAATASGRVRRGHFIKLRSIRPEPGAKHALTAG